MYNYCQVIGTLKGVNKENKSLTLELQREFRNAEGVYEKYEIVAFVGNLYDFVEDYINASIGQKIVIKGRIEPREDKCIFVGERIIGLSNPQQDDINHN